MYRQDSECTFLGVYVSFQYCVMACICVCLFIYFYPPPPSLREASACLYFYRSVCPSLHEFEDYVEYYVAPS